MSLAYCFLEVLILNSVIRTTLCWLLLWSGLAKQAFSEFVQKEIFEPLGMKDAFVYRPFLSPDRQEIATGFRLSLNNEPVTYPPNYLDGVVGDKGIYVSINDMQKWLGALQANQLLPKTKDSPYLKAGTLEGGETTFYAMGWVRVDTPSVAFHDGAWRGFHSHHGMVYKRRTTRSCCFQIAAIAWFICNVSFLVSWRKNLLASPGLSLGKDCCELENEGKIREMREMLGLSFF